MFMGGGAVPPKNFDESIDFESRSPHPVRFLNTPLADPNLFRGTASITGGPANINFPSKKEYDFLEKLTICHSKEASRWVRTVDQIENSLKLTEIQQKDKIWI